LQLIIVIIATRTNPYFSKHRYNMTVANSQATLSLLSLFALTSLWSAPTVVRLDLSPPPARLGLSSSTSASTAPTAPDPDLLVIAYSTDPTDQAMLWTSAQAHSSQDVQDSDNKTKMLATGLGVKLNIHEPQYNRGWMHRFRQVVTKIMAEYVARGGQDFLVLAGDASDAYVTKSEHNNTLSLIKNRFLHDFNASIVFSSQIYCCNPWNLHEVGRAAWDEHYNAVGGPETLYKHLNAGLYIGYATAIIDMANDLNVFETEYKSSHTFNGGANMHMFDIDVDDDEWQLSVWYLKEHRKRPNSPRAILDVHQHLFTTTGTQRGAFLRADFLVFSENEFYSMIGSLPATFNRSRLDEVNLCPYAFNTTTKTWMNTITHRHPLAFHFAGDEWICGCEIMGKDQFHSPHRYAVRCPQEAPFWYQHANQGIKDADPTMYHLLRVASEGEIVVHNRRRRPW
jgi:hypothetical protein